MFDKDEYSNTPIQDRCHTPVCEGTNNPLSRDRIPSFKLSHQTINFFSVQVSEEPMPAYMISVSRKRTRKKAVPLYYCACDSYIQELNYQFQMHMIKVEKKNVPAYFLFIYYGFCGFFRNFIIVLEF